MKEKGDEIRYLLNELSDILIGSILGLSGLIPFVHVNTIIEILIEFDYTNSSFFIASLVFARLPLELLAATRGLTGADVAIAINSFKRVTSLELVLFNCIAGMLVALALFPAFSIIAPLIYPFVKDAAPVAVAGVLLWFLATEKNKYAFLIVILAGAAGIIILSKNLNNGLLILLTGLYGAPSLLFEEKEEKQIIEDQQTPSPTSTVQKTKTDSLLLISIGSITGMASSFLPAMTPAMLAIVLLAFFNQWNRFVLLYSSLIGSRAVSDFAAMEFLQKGRSGATATLLGEKFFSFTETYLLILVGIAVAIAFCFIAIKLNNVMPQFSKTVKLCFVLLMFIYVFYSDGFIGIAAFATCISIGLTATVFKVGKPALGGSIAFAAIRNYFP